MMELAAQAMVCGWCDFHFPLEAGPHLELLVDEGSFNPLDSSTGPARLGWATLAGRPLAIAVSDPTSRWDAKEITALTDLAEKAAREHQPLLWVVTAVQGVEAPQYWPGLQIALDRVGKAIPEQVHSTPLPRITLISGPAYGPAAALAIQADLVLAEPGAVIAPVLPEVLREAGRLPIESTRPPRQLLREGWADAILPRQTQKVALANLLDLLGVTGKGTVTPPSLTMPEQLPAPFRRLFVSFRELVGDRQSADDPALSGGLARLKPDGAPLLVLATARGEGKTRARRHAGAIGVAGWRKATRLLRLAGRFGLPVILLLDGPTLRIGRRRDPSEVTAALGETIHTLLTLPVPTVTVCIAASDDLAARALSATDHLLVRDDLAPRLQEMGLLVSSTFAHDLDIHLPRVVQELEQSYLQHGPLGRRALGQHRYIRWARLQPPSG
jgi:acetyl-CoA carboxylase carboxyl transferase subunit beta